ncbi:MAG: hypothetical protein ABIE94_01175 [archaeon]
MAKIKIPELYWAQSNGRKTNNPFDGTLPDVLTDEHFVCVVWGRPVPKRKQKEEPERTSSDTGLRLPEPEETDGRIMRFTHPNGYGTKPITDSYGSTQYATTGRGAAATTLVAEPEIEVMPQWRVREEGIAERIIAINVGKTDCPGIRFRKMAHIVGQPRPHYVLFNSDEPHPLCFRRRLGTIV